MLVASASAARTALKNSQLIRQLPDESHVIYGTRHRSASRKWRNGTDWLERRSRCVVSGRCARLVGFSLAHGLLLSLIGEHVWTQRIPGYLQFITNFEPEPDLGGILA
jgi:hypothetical protein